MELMKPYNNKNWEPLFSNISPALAKLYFATNIGPIRRLIATIIFKKLSWIERRTMEK